LKTDAAILLQRVREHPVFHTFSAGSVQLGYTEASRLIVAVSGGGDSVALAMVAAAWAKEHGKEIVFAYFDHETDRSRNEAEWHLVTELSRVLSVPSARGSAGEYSDIVGRGPEETWRKQRYQFLRSLAGQSGLTLTGHTLDDAAETFLLAAFRGGTGNALSGIRRQRNDGVIRPFLGVRREQLRDLLRQLGVEWIEDTANDDETTPRVFVRRRILPELISRFGPKSLEGITRSARWFEELNDLADRLAQQAASELVRPGRLNETSLDLSRLRDYHPAVQRRVLRVVLAEKFSDPCSLLSRPADQLVRLVAKGRAFALGLPQGLRAVTRQDSLVIAKPIVGSSHGADRVVFIPVPGCVWLGGTLLGIAASAVWCGSRPFDSFAFALDTALLDSSEICGALRVRCRRPGERFRPLGAFSGTVKLKKYLRDRGVPIGERWHLPIVTDESGRLLWIPGVARSNVAAITEHTRHAILLRSVHERSLGSNLGG
jgi:tRNA(Ile)-lysidine synthase